MLYFIYYSDPGVRETRRFLGKKRLTKDDVENLRIPADTIALGSYKVDIHSGLNDTTILTDLERPLWYSSWLPY